MVVLVMSCASASSNCKQQNCSLKLKIKFSKSEGFVSDFVNDTRADISDQDQFVSSFSGSSFPAEQHLPAQVAHIPGKVVNNDTKNAQSMPLLGSSLQFSQISVTDWKPGDLDVGHEPLGRTTKHKSPLTPAKAETGPLNLHLDCALGGSCNIPSKETVSSPQQSENIEKLLHNELINHHLQSCGSEVVDRSKCFCIGDGHVNCQQKTCGIEFIENCTCDVCKSGNAVGGNHRKKLQDSEFLPSKQIEPQTRSFPAADRQREQHIATKLIGTHAPADFSVVMDRGVDLNNAGEVDQTGEAQAIHQSSDEEPVSPFDINCGLGLADEDFTFLSSSKGLLAKQKSMTSKPRENHLFPWSVEVTSDSDLQCVDQSLYVKPLKQLPFSPNQQDSRPPHYFDNMTCTSSVNDVGYSCGNPVVKTSTGFGRNADKRQRVVEDCQSRSTRECDSEINNNAYDMQISGSRSLSDYRPDNYSLSTYLPSRISVSDITTGTACSFIDSSHTQSFSEYSQSPTNTIEGQEPSQQSLAVAMHQTDRDIITGSRLKQESLVHETTADTFTPDLENGQSSVQRRHSADVLQPESLPQDTVSCSLQSVTCRHPSAVNAVSLKTNIEPTCAAIQTLEEGNSDHEKIKSRLLAKLLARKDSVPNILHTGRLPVIKTSPVSCSPCSSLKKSSSAASPSQKLVEENPSSVVTSSSRSAVKKGSHSGIKKTRNRFKKNLSSTKPVRDKSNKNIESAAEGDGNTTQLKHTIDELRKRISEPESSRDTAEIPQDSESLALADHLPEMCHTSGDNPVSKERVSKKWCRCSSPVPHNSVKECKGYTTKPVSNEEMCTKCLKRISRRWKKSVRQMAHGMNKHKNTCCRCSVPEPLVYQCSDKRVGEVCLKCRRRISNRWKRHLASYWCKCRTPLLCRFGLDSNAENMSGKLSKCSNCWKWVSKYREENQARDVNNQPSTENTVIPIVDLHPAMVDHNYCQLFSSSAGSQMPLNSSAISTSDRVSHTAECQSNEGCELVRSPETDFVHTFPSESRFHENHSHSHVRLKDAEVKICDEENSDISLGNEDISDCSPGHAVPGTDVTSTGLSSETYFQTSSDTNNTPKPSSDGFFMTSASSADCIMRETSVENTDSAEEDDHLVYDKCYKKTVFKEVSTSVLPQGGSYVLMEPCFVVLEKLHHDLLCRQNTAGSSPCPVFCRQKHLNTLCKLGKLQQCSHSKEHQPKFQQQSVKRMSVWNRKRDFFRRNRSMHGYEEYKHKELRNRMKRLEEQMAVENTEISDKASSFTSTPLSSVGGAGMTHLRISTKDGIKIQQMPEGPLSIHCPLRQNSSSLLDAGASQNVRKKSVTTSSYETDPVKGTADVNCHAGSNTWLKVSRFNVKYYVFQCGGRAFVVPFIHDRRFTKKHPASVLDEEDLGYVKAVICRLLVEKDSCARHLKYPDGVKCKGSHKADGPTSNVKEAPARKAFVAPTLGAQDLGIEELKALISDKDFSRLVPQNSRISKSKYLQQIGEKVHMYLTGGTEETPDWIKDVARSIVMKQRVHVQNKRRLKPSKDVSIEIDYACEDECIDVGEEAAASLCSSVTDHAASFAEDSSSLPSEDVDQNIVSQPGPNSEPFHTSQCTGSYVIEEAFIQEEKKHLVGTGVVTNCADLVNASEINESITAPTQQIFIPLPPIGSHVPEHSETCVPPVPSFQDYGQKQLLLESSGDPGDQEREQLHGALPAAQFQQSSFATTEHMGQHGQEVGQQRCTFGLSSEQTVPAWPLPVVKQEPPDEDFSHAWPNEERSHGDLSSAQHAESFSAIPFISNSTFGRKVVQIEDDDGHSSHHLDENAPHVSSSDVIPSVKMEPMDTDDNQNVGIPLMTGTAEGMVPFVGENSGMEITGVKEESTTVMFDEEFQGQPQVLPRIVSVSVGEIVAPGIETCVPDGVTEAVDVPTCMGETVTVIVAPGDFDQGSLGQGKEFDCPHWNNTLGGKTESRMFQGMTESERASYLNEEKQAEDEIEPESLPQISAVTFGEAAMIWDRVDNEGPNESSETDHVVYSCVTVPESDPLSQCSVSGDGTQVPHEDGKAVFQYGRQQESPEQHQMFENDDEEFDADLLDTDNNTEGESVPSSEDQYISVGLPGKDLQISVQNGVSDLCYVHDKVKQEPQEIEESVGCPSDVPSHCFASSLNYNPCDGESFDEYPTAEKSSPSPAVLAVQSVDSLMLPSDAGPQKLQSLVDISKPSQSLQASFLDQVPASDVTTDVDKLTVSQEFSSPTEVPCRPTVVEKQQSDSTRTEIIQELQGSLAGTAYSEEKSEKQGIDAVPVEKGQSSSAISASSVPRTEIDGASEQTADITEVSPALHSSSAVQLNPLKAAAQRKKKHRRGKKKKQRKDPPTFPKSVPFSNETGQVFSVENRNSNALFSDSPAPLITSSATTISDNAFTHSKTLHRDVTTDKEISASEKLALITKFAFTRKGISSIDQQEKAPKSSTALTNGKVLEVDNAEAKKDPLTPDKGASAGSCVIQNEDINPREISDFKLKRKGRLDSDGFFLHAAKYFGKSAPKESKSLSEGTLQGEGKKNSKELPVSGIPKQVEINVGQTVVGRIRKRATVQTVPENETLIYSQHEEMAATCVRHASDPKTMLPEHALGRNTSTDDMTSYDEGLLGMNGRDTAMSDKSVTDHLQQSYSTNSSQCCKLSFERRASPAYSEKDTPTTVISCKPKTSSKRKRKGGSKSRKKTKLFVSSAHVSEDSLSKTCGTPNTSVTLQTARRFNSHGASLLCSVSDKRNNSPEPRTTRSSNRFSKLLSDGEGVVFNGVQYSMNDQGIFKCKSKAAKESSSVPPPACEMQSKNDVEEFSTDGSTTSLSGSSSDRKLRLFRSLSKPDTAVLSHTEEDFTPSPPLRQSDACSSPKKPFRTTDPRDTVQTKELHNSEFVSAKDSGVTWVTKSSKHKRSEGRVQLTLRKVKSTSPQSHTSVSDRWEADEYVSSDNKCFEKDSFMTIGILKKDSEAANSIDLPHSDSSLIRKRKFEPNDQYLKRKNNGESKSSKMDRSIFSDISAVLSTMATPSSPATSSSSAVSSGTVSSDRVESVNKLSVDVVKNVKKSLTDGLFSRLKASLNHAKTDVTATVNTGSGPGGMSARVEEDSGPQQNPQERSFFDCLPQGFVNAWKD